MNKQSVSPTDPNVLEKVRQRIQSMTDDELAERIAYRPEGVEESWLGKPVAQPDLTEVRQLVSVTSPVIKKRGRHKSAGTSSAHA